MKSNNQDYDEKTMKPTEDFKSMLASTITSMMDHINMLEYSPPQKDPSKPQDPTTVVQDNRRSPQFGGGHSTNIYGIWTLKHDIISPKFYKILINTELKRDTALDLNNFNNHINIFPNAVTRLREDLLPAYQSIKRHYDFEE